MPLAMIGHLRAGADSAVARSRGERTLESRWSSADTPLGL